MVGVCVAILVAGLVVGLRWVRLPFRSPPVVDDPSAGEVARRFAWYCSVLLLGGIGAGLTVIGAGGRLAMRLLAVTAGDSAQGRITEADEVVGEITVDGTIGFILFIGIFGGVITAAIYLVVRRFLPAGAIGGVAFGAALLLVFGATIDPLRDDNRDFDIVGPGWLAVLVFTAMALAYGVVLHGFMARASAWLPLPSTERRVLVRYIPVVLVAALGFSVTAFLVVLGVVVVLLTRWRALVDMVRSPTYLKLGRALVVVLVLAFAPNAILSAADIVSR